MTLIADFAPSAIKENDMKSYFGRKIAIDASMCIYQFIIAIRSDGDVLMNEHGEVTSHLQVLSLLEFNDFTYNNIAAGIALQNSSFAGKWFETNLRV